MPDIYSPDGMRAAPMALSPVSAYLLQTSLTIAASGTLVLAPQINNQRNRLYKLVLLASAAATIQFQDQGEGGAAANLSGVMSLATGTPFVLPFDGQPWYQTASGLALPASAQNALQLAVTITGTLSGTAWYTQAP